MSSPSSLLLARCRPCSGSHGSDVMFAFLPYPVISGLMTGIGIIIIIQQIFPVARSRPFAVLRTLSPILQSLGGTLQGGVRPGAVLLAAATVALAFLLPRLDFCRSAVSRRSRRAHDHRRCLWDFGSKTVGDIPSGLPRFIIPNFDFADLKLIITAAFQLCLPWVDRRPRHRSSLTTSPGRITTTAIGSLLDKRCRQHGCCRFFGGIPGARGVHADGHQYPEPGGRHRSSGTSFHGLQVSCSPFCSAYPAWCGTSPMPSWREF